MNKLFVILLLGVFLVSFASALDIDNWVNYENDDLKVRINNWLNFGGEILTAELKSHKSVDEILKFAPGKDVVTMYYDVDSKELYKNGLGEVFFTNMTSGELIEKDYYFVKWGTIIEKRNNYSKECNDVYNEANKTYSKVCESILVGTYTEEVDGWIRMDTNDIPKEKVRIGLATDVNVGDAIDGVWTIAGKKISKHSEWTADLNVDIISYWAFDEGSSGTIIDSLNINNATNNGATNTSSKNSVLKYAYDFETGESDYMDTSDDPSLDVCFFTVSVWFKPESFVANAGLFAIGTGTSDILQLATASNAIILHLNSVGGGYDTTLSDPIDSTSGEWYNVVARWNGTTRNIYINGVLNASEVFGSGCFVGASTGIRFGRDIGDVYQDGIIDQPILWNRSVTDGSCDVGSTCGGEIAQLYDGGTGIIYTDVFNAPPSVVLTSPEDNANLTSTTVEFIATITDDIKVENVTLFIDGIANETNSSNFNGTYTFTKAVSIDEHNWSILAYDNESVSNQSETRSFNITSGIIVTLNSPPNDTLQDDTNVTFNWTISPIGVNISNWTLNVWYTNGTMAHQHINTSINTDETTTVIHTDTLFFDESYIWDVESWGTNAASVNDISENRTFRIDTIPPVVNITYPPENFIVTQPQQNITLNYTIIHPVGDLSNCFFNTTFNATTINISCTDNTTSLLYPNTDPASLTIFVFGNDTAGNIGVGNVTILKDTTDPQIEFVSPTTESGSFGQDYIVANITAIDDGLDTITTFLYNLTDLVTSIQNSTSPALINFTGLPDTTYFLNATANDSFGNTNSTETRTILLDTTNPQIEFVSPTTESGAFYINTQDFIVTNVTVIDASLDTITTSLYNSTSLVTSIQNSTSPVFINFTGLSEGTYFINATANDTFGNTNSTETRTIYLIDGSISKIWTDEYQVRIIAGNLTESDFEINNVVVTQEDTFLWKINTTESDYEVARAQVMKTFFYGTNGANARIPLVTGLLKIQSRDIRDDGKRGHYAAAQSVNQGGADIAYTGTFTNTTDNTDCSSWSKLVMGAEIDGSVWQIPVGTNRNFQGPGGTSDEIGTDTSADEVDNPTDSSLNIDPDSPPNSAGTAQAILFCVGDITWVDGGFTSASNIDFFTDNSIPLVSPVANITLNSPENNLINQADSNIIFNITSTISGSTLNSIKFFIDGTLNETKSISGTQNTTIFTKSFSILGDYNWSVEVCDISDNCALSSTRDFEIEPFGQLSQTFEENITEGELNNFSVLINVSDGSSLTGATFSYNNTNYTATIIFGSGLYLISSSIISPNIDADTNFSFNFFLVIDGTTYTTTPNNQTVFNSLFDICGGLSNDTLLNMSLLDEETGSKISGDIEVYASIVSKSSGSSIGTINTTFENVEYGAICFSPTEEYPLYYINTEIRYSSDGYAPELYYIQSGDMSDYPRNLDLLDLNQSDSTEFVITYQNDAFIFVEGAVIQLQRRYIGEDVYKVVEAPVTSDGGKAIVHIDLNTNIYRASVVKDGVVLDVFDGIVFSCDNELAGDCEEKLEGAVNPNNDVQIEDITDFTYSVSVSDVNNTVTTSFVVPSGTPSSINVLLEQIDMFGNVTACNNTLITSAGSITCDFNDTIEKSILQLTISKDNVQLAITSYGVDPELDMDGMNFFIVFLFTISLVGMAIASPEWMMIIGVMVFMISGTLLLLKGMSLVMGLGAMAWLVVAVIIIILKMAKQEDR